MKLAFVSTILCYPWGGADVLWTRAAERALALGHQVFIAVAPAVANHPRIAALGVAGARLHLRTGHTQHRGRRERWTQAVGQALRAPSSLVGALDAFAPDVVYLCQGGVWDFLVEDGLVRWLEKTACPCVPVCQSNDDRDVVAPESQAPARAFLAGARATIFVSTHNRDLAGRQCGEPVPRATVVANPVELPAGPAPAWPAETTPRLAVVTRLEADAKGLDVLLQAVARLGTGGDWRIDIFGRGPDEAALRAEAASLKVEDKINFAGYSRDIRSLWSNHHLLLLPSRREGCALALLEALACGRPVLTADSGGARDWIESGVNGYLCPSGSPEALANTLRTAFGEFHRWPQFGAAAHRVFVERHPSEPERSLLTLAQISPC